MRLEEIPQAAPSRYEALVDTGVFILGGAQEWCPVRKLAPKARYPIVVEVADVGAAKCKVNEILDIRHKETRR